MGHSVCVCVCVCVRACVCACVRVCVRTYARTQDVSDHPYILQNEGKLFLLKIFQTKGAWSED